VVPPTGTGSLSLRQIISTSHGFTPVN
jgi:hypothetical protein